MEGPGGVGFILGCAPQPWPSPPPPPSHATGISLTHLAPSPRLFWEKRGWEIFARLCGLAVGSIIPAPSFP